MTVTWKRHLPHGTEVQVMGHVLVGVMLLGLLSDPATGAMRREAEAGRKQKRDAFDRIKALPAPPREQLQPVARAIPFQRGRIVVMPRGIVVRRLLDLPPQGDSDEDNGPKVPPSIVSEETFDQVVFGSTGDVASGRVYLEKILEGKIGVVAQVRRLSPAQKKRLSLAGRGDIKRLFDQIEEERKEFQGVRDDLDRCVKFRGGLRPLQLALRQGPFEFDSIFAKTLKKMLDEGELARRGPKP
jgi:hypothetical protein